MPKNRKNNTKKKHNSYANKCRLIKYSSSIQLKNLTSKYELDYGKMIIGCLRYYNCLQYGQSIKNHYFDLLDVYYRVNENNTTKYNCIDIDPVNDKLVESMKETNKRYDLHPYLITPEHNRKIRYGKTKGVLDIDLSYITGIDLETINYIYIGVGNRHIRRCSYHYENHWYYLYYTHHGGIDDGEITKKEYEDNRLYNIQFQYDYINFIACANFKNRNTNHAVFNLFLINYF
jgi:hypothetical protein